MFKKISYSSEGFKTLGDKERNELFASEEITERLSKFAKKALAIAPKSEDFLYFTIIFMKAAESCLIDDRGDLKKVGSEQAWGHFDEKWIWKGNVKPHRNKNLDIFPELELKKAYRKWVGMPLCVDHKSDSVDGVRGVILDTHYDEKLKQVVGLCALDRKAYPDLARKVETGVVRYGSMGTAVGISVCSDCGNHAKVASEFCNHVKSRNCWGEINVDLKPIEYSLVVQPAEPGAILLKCIASIKEHGDELKNLGVDDIDSFVHELTADQAQELESILKEACGENGCSLNDRQKMINAYLNNIELTKTASVNHGHSRKASNEDLVLFSEALRNLSEATGKKADPNDPMFKAIFEKFNINLPESDIEQFTSNDTILQNNSIVQDGQGDVNDYTGISSGINSSPPISPSDSFKSDGLGPENYAFSSINKNEIITNLNKDNIEIKSILGDIMNQSNLKKRSEALKARALRRQAYMQGGSEGREPTGFKSEDYHKYWESDKHMHQDKGMGKPDDMFPGDKDTKEKLSRAKLRERALRRRAYMQGGSEGREPAGFKSEDYHKHWESDKHMHQDKSMGKPEGMFPGDKEVKEKLSRAKYSGPALSTKFKQARNKDGSVNKKASVFEVYSGDELIISNTAGDILGPNLHEDFDMLTSTEFAKTVVSKIRELGINKVASRLGAHMRKNAQQAPAAAPPAPAAAPAAPAAMPAPAAPPADEALSLDDLGVMGGPEMGPEPMKADESQETSEVKMKVETLLDQVENSVDQIRDLVAGEAESEDKLSLSSRVTKDLKIALAEANEALEELSYIRTLLNDIHKLSYSKRSDLRKVASSAAFDAATMLGESNTLVRVAASLKADMVKTSKYEEVTAHSEVAEDSFSNELIEETLKLRASKRNSLLKKAKLLAKSKRATAQMADDLTDAAEDCAEDKKNDSKDEELENDSDDSALSTPELPTATAAAKDSVKEKLTETFTSKKASEDKEAYKVRVRRAYELSLEMQKKGMIDQGNVSRDRQVDELLNLDDKAFESMKRIVSNTKAAVKTASVADLGGINNGIRESVDSSSSTSRDIVSELATMFSRSK